MSSCLNIATNPFGTSSHFSPETPRYVLRKFLITADVTRVNRKVFIESLFFETAYCAEGWTLLLTSCPFKEVHIVANIIIPKALVKKIFFMTVNFQMNKLFG
jgi:hypothetical protein